MSNCQIHNVQMTLRESKTKLDDEGNPKTYFAHPTVDGKLCFGEKKTGQARNGSEQFNHQVPEVVKHSSEPMLKCNAMNNAVAYISANSQGLDALEVVYRQILGVLEK